MRISVVIPTLNEAESLGSVLDCMNCQAGETEVIVSDGGSTDATLAIAARLGARVICGAKGRGQQLRRGAAPSGNSNSSASILTVLLAPSLMYRISTVWPGSKSSAKANKR